LTRLGALLGLPDIVLMVDYGDIGREIDPEELGAVWIGLGEPEHTSSPDRHQQPVLERFSAPLHDAAAKDNIAEIERLVASGAEINEIPHPYTLTALATAAQAGSPQTLRKLVELGADLHKKGPQGATPLGAAVQSGQVENIRTLVELGARVDEFDNQLGTLLHLAVVQVLSPDVVRLLLELGVDPQRTGSGGLTPLELVQARLAGMEHLKAKMPKAYRAALTLQVVDLEEIRRLLSGPIK
jgi:ankyrin repeat protein